MFAELTEEFAVAAAEAVGVHARDQQHAEDPAALLDEQRNATTRNAARPRRAAARNGNVHRAMSGSYTSSPRHAARQVRSRRSRCLRLFGRGRAGRARRAARADARHRQLALDLVVLAQAREVDRQVFLEAAHHHLEDAGEVLALGDGVGDLLQQAQPAELVECLALGQLARGRLGAQRRIGFFQVRGSLAHAVFERFVDAREDVLHAHPARRVDRAHLRDA